MKYDNVVDNYIQLNLKIKSSSLYVSNIVCNNFTEKKKKPNSFHQLKTNIKTLYTREKHTRKQPCYW